MKLEFSELIFEKYSNIKFNDNLSDGNCVFPCRWTEASSHFSQFCEHA